MKWKVLLVPFPFDDLSSSKMRPAVCLTHEIGPYKHIVIAFVTSQAEKATEETDILLAPAQSDFSNTGLKVASAVRLHRLMTIPTHLVKRELGVLGGTSQRKVEEALRRLFGL